MGASVGAAAGARPAPARPFFGVVASTSPPPFASFSLPASASSSGEGFGSTVLAADGA